MEELEPVPVPVAAIAADCKSCFEKINETDQFCQACGFPIKGSEYDQSQFLYHRNYRQMEIDGLQSKVKSARTTLFVLAGIFFLYGIVVFAFNNAADSGIATLLTYGVVGIIFLFLGWWAEKKPVASLISGMSLYILLQLMAVFEDPANLIKGVLVKIIIISYLVKGLKSALEAEKIRKQYHI